MGYAAGVGGAKSSTIYPCGHMAYYDSGTAPSIICPICGARHQNASLMQYVAPTYSASGTNVNMVMSQVTGQMIQQGIEVADPALVPELKYPDLAWLDREVSRYTKR